MHEEVPELLLTLLPVEHCSMDKIDAWLTACWLAKLAKILVHSIGPM